MPRCGETSDNKWQILELVRVHEHTINTAGTNNAPWCFDVRLLRDVLSAMLCQLLLLWASLASRCLLHPPLPPPSSSSTLTLSFLVSSSPFSSSAASSLPSCSRAYVFLCFFLFWTHTSSSASSFVASSSSFLLLPVISSSARSLSAVCPLLPVSPWFIFFCHVVQFSFPYFSSPSSSASFCISPLLFFLLLLQFIFLSLFPLPSLHYLHPLLLLLLLSSLFLSLPAVSSALLLTPQFFGALQSLDETRFWLLLAAR